MSEALSLFKYIDLQQIIYIQVINPKLSIPLCSNQALLQLLIIFTRTLTRFPQAFVIHIARATKHTTC